MKKNLLFLTALFIAITINVNGQTYSFTKSTSTYTELTSGTVISIPYWDDFSVFGVQLPFAFTYFGTSFDSLYIMGGFAGFTYDGMGSFGDFEIASYEYAALGDNQTQTATISIETSGSSPNRIFKIQTKDAGFVDDQSGQDVTNFQMWFYESSNVIEMHYGSSSVTDPTGWEIPGSTGPGVILAQTNMNFVALSGPAANPNATTTFVSFTLTGTPPDGIVYRFAPGASGIDETASNNSFRLFPNPSNGNFQIELKDILLDATFSVYNLSGQKVYSTNCSNGSAVINLSLSSGLYIAEIKEGEKIIRKKLVIE